jgi:hypothetical protein
MKSTVFLTNSQKRVMCRLRKEWQSLNCRTIINGIKMARTTPLIIGPSGSGKSLVVSRLAYQLQIPYLRINVRFWQESDATGGTLENVADFVSGNPEGIIFLDEIDTLGVPLWGDATYTEVLNLLDCNPVLTENKKWNDQLWGKFYTGKYMIVAAGAWRDSPVSPVNLSSFGCDMDDLNYQEKRIAQELKERYRRRLSYQTIEEEIPMVAINKNIESYFVKLSKKPKLMSRFDQRWLLLESPRRSDFLRGIIGIHRRLKLALPSKNQLITLAGTAEASDYGLRWLEMYLRYLFKTYQLSAVPHEVSDLKDLLLIPTVSRKVTE